MSDHDLRMVRIALPIIAKLRIFIRYPRKMTKSERRTSKI